MAKSEKRKAKSEKRKAKSEKRKAKSEKHNRYKNNDYFYNDYKNHQYSRFPKRRMGIINARGGLNTPQIPILPENPIPMLRMSSKS
ncbi:MAG: hypothetical protein H6556_04870 [Lewinellaceae bacterium]|nr:hypothetical protein [Lewinellaceae bacterium]